jgi:HK97 family phage major capsid protein
MRQVNLASLKNELQTLADQVGEKRFGVAKALYLEKVMVTDEDGTPVAAEDLEVILAPKMVEGEDEEEKAVEDEEEAKAEEDEEEKVAAKSIAPTFRKGLRQTAAASAPSIVRPKMYGSLKNFKDDSNGEAFKKAERFGRWLLAQRGHHKSLNWCERNGLEVKAHTEGVNSAGGFLVPEEFETDLISLREEFGVFRRNARVRPMGSDTLRLPRRSATLTANFVGEATAGTESTQTFESVLLVAKKVMVLTTVSNELNEDSFVNLADDIAGEVAYAFALKEDECGFIGDGSSTYGGITGVATAVAAGSAGVNYFDGALTTSADITLADVNATMALLPAFADSPNAKFYMHKSTWHGGFEKVAAAAGGTSGREIQEGYRGTPTFFGYPVEFSQVMQSGTYDANSAVALFGDLSMAASFGDRRSTEVQISDSALNAFEQDELAIRGTERFDINVHDIAPVVALRA